MNDMTECPIHKKKDTAIYTNYRPISLLDIHVLSKTFETQIARHITKGICRNGYLPDTQYGFRAKHSCSDLAYAVIGKAVLTVDQRRTCHLLQTDIAGAFDRVDRAQLALRLLEAGVRGQMHKLLIAYLTNRVFRVRLDGAQSQEYPLDVGVVQGSGLGPVMWNIYFAPVFDATQGKGIGFADDLNLLTDDHTEMEQVKAETEASCSAARITTEPAKEVQTTFFPPRHPDSIDQHSVRLVGIQVDPNTNMKDHIAKVLSKARIAKTRLARMKPYCSEDQLLSLYKTMIWSALEVGSVCYAHADKTSLNKLQHFQDSTLRQLGLNHRPIDSLETRQKVAFMCMVYKQVVLGEGPNFIRDNFPIKPPGPRDHLSRTTTEKHQYQLSFPLPPTGCAHLKRFNDFCTPLVEWNNLPTLIMPTTPGLQQFKVAVAGHYCAKTQ